MKPVKEVNEEKGEDVKTATSLLIQGVKLAQTKGVYTLEESSILLQAIKIVENLQTEL